MSDLSLRVIAAWLDCFQEMPSWCRNEQISHGRKSVKPFEWSNGLDTVLYKTYILFTSTVYHYHVMVVCLVYRRGGSNLLPKSMVS